MKWFLTEEIWQKLALTSVTYNNTEYKLNEINKNEIDEPAVNTHILSDWPIFELDDSDMWWTLWWLCPVENKWYSLIIPYDQEWDVSDMIDSEQLKTWTKWEKNSIADIIMTLNAKYLNTLSSAHKISHSVDEHVGAIYNLFIIKWSPN